MPTPKLFSSFALRDVVFKNRIVASPMWQYCAEDGFPTDWHLMNLGRLADGGAGLVFQEGTTVERRGCGTPGDLGLWDDKYVEPLTRLATFMRANGTVPGIQLMHTGRKARRKAPFDGRGPLEQAPDMADWDSWQPVAPSAIAENDTTAPPRALSLSEVQDAIAAFVTAAARARRAGYDVVELHGAHGYLIHQFLSPAANQRTDQYGGSFANRIRFLSEIVEGVRSVWDDRKPITVRLSCIDNTGWEITDTVALVKVLKTLGVDAIDCSSGGLVGSPFPAGTVLDYGYQVGYAAHVRRETGVPTIAVGLIVHAAQAEKILNDGAADFVALARELIYNPCWPIDAAQKLGADPGFNNLSPRTRFWLANRAAAKPDIVPSTFQ